MKLQFSSKDLRNIHSIAEKSISTHLAKLDEVSNDIKALEDVLSKAGISINFRYWFESERAKGQMPVNEFESVATKIEIFHYMVWCRDKQRLLYEVETTQREVVDKGQSYRQWGPMVSISKPLIETKAHIRLKVRPELQHFYNRIIERLGHGHLQETVEEASPNLDIPFL